METIRLLLEIDALMLKSVIEQVIGVISRNQGMFIALVTCVAISFTCIIKKD